MRILNRLRLKSIEENRLGRYIIYAIGEVLIIVAGIIVALNINNWNEDRKAQLFEVKTLKEIKKGFESDLVDIDANIRLQTSIIESCEIILYYLGNKLQYNDSINKHFANLSLFTRFIDRSAPYQTLTAHGLDVISNDSVRLKIAHVYDYDYQFIKEIQEMQSFSRRDISLYLKMNFKEFQILESAKPINYNKLCNDNYFINLVNSYKGSNNLTSMYYKATRNRIIKIIEEIDLEIMYLSQ